MTATLMIVLCLASQPTECHVVELEVEPRVCQMASLNAAQAWVATHRPWAVIRRIRCTIGRPA